MVHVVDFVVHYKNETNCVIPYLGTDEALEKFCDELQRKDSVASVVAVYRISYEPTVVQPFFVKTFQNENKKEEK